MKFYKILTISLLAASTTWAMGEEATPQVDNAYTYWSLGAGIPTLLSPKVGYRTQHNHV